MTIPTIAVVITHGAEEALPHLLSVVDGLLPKIGKYAEISKYSKPLLHPEYFFRGLTIGTTCPAVALLE